MKVLVIGQGGREHALVHALSHSPSVTEVHALPGNAGMKNAAIMHSVSWQDREALINLCLRLEIDVVIIGPEDPLVAGLADQLRERGILVVGPGAEAAQLEGSKVFAKQFMDEAGIPTARWSLVASTDECMKHSSEYQPPFVLKANGLAAGKGVFICKSKEELKTAATELFDQKILGDAGEVAVLEEFSPGWELSYLVLTNGKEFEALPVAQDHKRLLDGDQGPNTGGMGTVAPVVIDQHLREQIHSQIVEPTLQLLQSKGYIYRGVIFFGVMVTDKGPSLLEYNCRFGDPETQVILPLVETDWGNIFKNLSLGKMIPLQKRNLSAACVVLAAPGYPFHPEKNLKISGDPMTATANSYFIHSGTTQASTGDWSTTGGRVMGSVGLGPNIKSALQAAYEQASQVKWPGLQMRKDIGHRCS